MTVQMFPPPTACSRASKFYCVWLCGGRKETEAGARGAAAVQLLLLLATDSQSTFLYTMLYAVHAKACRMPVLNYVASAVGLPLSALAWCLFDISQWCAVFSKG